MHRWLGPWLVATASLAGCAAGALREARVGPLAAYPGARGIAVESAAGPVEAGLLAGAQRGLARANLGAPDAEPHFRLRFTVLTAEGPTAPVDGVGGALSAARSFAGLAGAGASGASAGRLEISGTLLAPDQREVGFVRWESEGSPEALAGDAGEASALVIARLIPERRSQWIARRAADERLVFTPTAQTLAPGTVAFTDDELALVRFAVGVSRRVQLDLWAGGIPIPAAGGFGGAAHALFAVGGAGVVVFGFFDLGVKVKVLEETDHLPGVALSYDLLDLFGLGAGGAGVVIAGDGVGGGGYGVVGGANAQFNLLTAVVAKHFGPAQITLGTYVLDNHHYLPQSAGFQSGCAVVASDGNQSAAGGALDCGSGSTKLGRLPVQVFPFVGSELVLGPHSALMLEALLAGHIQDTMVSTGARWLLGFRHPHGPLALDRVRFRIDLAALWRYEPPDHGAHPHGAQALAFPWLGIGAYIQ